MTFEEFQATKRYGVLAELCPDTDWTDYPTHGNVYADGLWIADVSGPDGRWELTLDRDGWISDDLTSLERRLYAFGVGEGFIDAPADGGETTDDDDDWDMIRGQFVRAAAWGLVQTEDCGGGQVRVVVATADGNYAVTVGDWTDDPYSCSVTVYDETLRVSYAHVRCHPRKVGRVAAALVQVARAKVD